MSHFSTNLTYLSLYVILLLLRNTFICEWVIHESTLNRALRDKCFNKCDEYCSSGYGGKKEQRSSFVLLALTTPEVKSLLPGSPAVDLLKILE